jgi:ubiquitin-like-conjugating enzyme ATG3
MTQGVLTPQEFVAAGDSLIAACPTWTWSSGVPGKIKSYLPSDKQYLVTRGVPCYHRIQELDASTQVNQMLDNEWCAPSLKAARTSTESEDVDGFDMVERAPTQFATSSGKYDAKAAEAPSAAEAPPAAAVYDDDDEYADMEDEAMALDAATTATGTDGSGAKHTGILLARRYDCSVTYDKFYRTPRIWLEGTTESGTPLPPVKIFEDIMQDYAQKTVTVEWHPHEDMQCVSIHPCQHAAAMLNVINSLLDCGKPPKPEQSLFIFLKFILYLWAFCISKWISSFISVKLHSL